MTDQEPYDRPDMLDRSAELSPDGSVFALRERRPEFLYGAESCRRSVLEPEDDLGLDPVHRTAIARRLAATGGQLRLLDEFDLPENGDLRVLAEGRMPEDPLLAAIARHADLISLRPGDSTAEGLDALAQAGLSVPQIVALSELLAFVGFQIRVAAGLHALEAAG